MIPCANWESLSSLDDRPDVLSANRCLDDILNIAEVDAVACYCFPVYGDVQKKPPLGPLCVKIRRSRDFAQYRFRRDGKLLQCVEITAKYFHSEVCSDSGGEHVDAVDDRLSPTVADTRNLKLCVEF